MKFRVDTKKHNNYQNKGTMYKVNSNSTKAAKMNMIKMNINKIKVKIIYKVGLNQLMIDKELIHKAH